ncbi:MAG: hypothetical protein ACTID3_16430 [Halomonas sp.]|uniref:hypothetical protein n=1 Tax=unclassified Halomonas TaxID=2609666 RepID=UPI000C338FB8|nr:hypothetical protein [Halomonas sp. MES3-P3E]PKG48397.1 hypothetical protein CXF87_18025 [Halomonas sp. MES3-P3E]|tara:strand:+ start:4984 stop:6162 length:1179 start_codon:yes stop_codon:yes gene_type:complete
MTQLTRLCAAFTFVVLTLPALAEDAPALATPQVDQSNAISLLSKAVEHFDELTQLPESHWVRRDQDSATRDITNLIEDALEVLDIPELSSIRNQYRQVEDRIRDEELALAELREKRLLAPEGDAGTLTRWTPTETLRNFTARTRGDFEMLVEIRQGNVEAYRDELAQLRRTLAEQLRKIDINMPPDQVELWLSSAIGNDVISMSVVFNSIHTITERLEELTHESGENLSFAKRYYGMVVILHKLVVHMQNSFVEKVDNDILPRLEEFQAEADEIIAESRRLIREGGNRTTLETNIAANELTKQAISLYQRVVRGQRDKVADALAISRREESVAINTYRTVSLSANVAGLIRDGLSTFETLSNLQVPDTANFENAEVREEFRQLTERLSASSR